MENAVVIKFYSIRDKEYGCFSNFAAAPFELDGKYWPTTEHYYQAQKFLDPTLQKQVRQTKKPGDAARLGRDRKLPLREDWNEVRDSVMEKALIAKFTQHKDMRELLLSTGDATLIEHTVNDSYWGDGGDGTGKNMLGIMLMKVRAQLRNAAG